MTWKVEVWFNYKLALANWPTISRSTCVYCSECKTPTQNCWVLFPKFLDIPCISLLDPEPAKLLLQWILVSLNGPITLPVRQAQYPKVIFILFLPQFYFQSVSNCCPIILTMPLQADSLSAVLTPLVPHFTISHLGYCYGLWSGLPASTALLLQSILLIVATIIFPKYKSHHATNLVKY